LERDRIFLAQTFAMRIFVSAFDCVDFMWDFSEILRAQLKFEQI